MIGICLSSAWPQYYAASPYNNIITSTHDRFVHLESLPHNIDHDAVNKCEAIITDEILVDHLRFYTNGPKLLIGGDIHAHDAAGVRRRELDFAGSDYVLSGGIFAPRHPNYKYFDDRYRAQLVYLPNCVPDNKFLPKLLDWHDRRCETQLSGSVSEVYPYRLNAKPFTTSLPALPREQYFAEIAKYKSGLTCNSILTYTVAKYFEIPWVGSLLIAPPIQDVEQELLGFNESNTMFTNDPKPIIDRVKIDRSGFFQEVTLQGASLVRKRHTAWHRLEYISRISDAIIKGNFKPDDALQIFKGIL